MSRWTIVSVLVSMVACGGGQKATPGGAEVGGGAAADPAAVYGPLEVGADWQTYQKVSKDKFPSPTHGNRFVEVYVNQVGLAAYTSEEAFPVGSVLVKPSWEADGDQASTAEGPIFVMEKREAGFSPDHEDWYYGIRWENPTGPLAKNLKGPFYWRSPSSKVNYCWKCHDNYDRSVGLPPADMRTWTAE